MNKQNTPLRTDLPPALEAELGQCRRYSVDDATIALYTLVDLPETELREICAKIKTTFNDNILQMEEWEVDDFISPAPGWNKLVQKDLGQVLEYHVRDLDKEWRDSSGLNEGEVQWYPFDFVVVTSTNWGSDGLVVVHCDYDRQSGRFTVDSCRMEVKELGFSVTSLRSGDDYFENLKSQFDMDGRSGD